MTLLLTPGYAQQKFGSPKEAAQALADAVKAGDMEKVIAIFGPDAKDLVSSGDEVSDQQAMQQFQERVKELTAVSVESDTSATVVIGLEAWPFAVPITKTGDKWSFDAAAGRETLLNRRIGANELSTLQTLRDLVAAQKNYFAADYDGDGVLEYAQKITSSEGLRDGLYWPDTDDVISPLGPLFADAAAEGYTEDKRTTGVKSPYHGYYYKVLTGQGESAHGGAYSYVINGNMIAGFAIVAWPVKYGDSGIMTFSTDTAGDIWSTDLGPEDTGKVEETTVFNPNENWLLEE